MLTVIGKSAQPAGAVDLLLECHDRIRSFLALALRIPGAVADDPALVAECELLSRDPGRLRERAASVAGAARELDAHFAVHLRGEEEVVFLAVRRLLDPAADLAVVREIRRRRGVTDAPPPQRAR
jgi:hypothetical protein